MRHHGHGFKVVDMVIEDDVDATGREVLLESLAVLVRVHRTEQLVMLVHDGHLLVRERVFDLARIL